MDISAGGKSLTGLVSINVIMGKNGCGKSQLLRQLDQSLQGNQEFSQVKYVSPERGGNLISDSGVFDSLQNNVNWGSDVKRRNRVENFRQISVAEFRNLEMMVLRSIESEPEIRANYELTFDSMAGSQINHLLENISLVRGDKIGFEIKTKSGDQARASDTLSSGESELVTLAIEILSFVYQANTARNRTRRSLLLLDEPDVHLHPDLQDRLIKMLVAAINDKPITVIIATHSTAILGALNQHDANVRFMKKNENELVFTPIDQQLRDILPVFGAHPLSNVFNQSPILLVEGEDDVRIWQQAVRSSEGRIKLWPCEAGSKRQLDQYEDKVSSLIGSIYDSAIAYSLRDRDEDQPEIDNKPNVERFRLNCREAENLILSDDVLEMLGTDWENMKNAMGKWLVSNPSHPKHGLMKSFTESFDRQNFRIKDLRLIFMDLANSNKPWEVVVGQAIAKLNVSSRSDGASLANYLGKKIVTQLKFCS